MCCKFRSSRFVDVWALCVEGTFYVFCDIFSQIMIETCFVCQISYCWVLIINLIAGWLIPFGMRRVYEVRHVKCFLWSFMWSLLRSPAVNSLLWRRSCSTHTDQSSTNHTTSIPIIMILMGSSRAYRNNNISLRESVFVKIFQMQYLRCISIQWHWNL